MIPCSIQSIRILTLPGCMLGLLLAVSNVAGQESVELLRKYPPSLLEQASVNNAMASIKWQLRQQSAIQTIYDRSRDEIVIKMKELSSRVDKLTQTLPPTIRFLDDEGRSATANSAMQKLLESRLELVSVQSLIAELEATMSDATDAGNEVERMELEMNKRAAQTRLQLVKSELETLGRQAQANLVSEHELQRTKYSLEIAEAEYAIAAKKAQMFSSADSVEAAKRLSQARVQVQPIEARIKTLEEFLHTLHKASEAISEIKRLEREQELTQRDLEWVSEALFESTHESFELQSFQSLLEDELKKD